MRPYPLLLLILTLVTPAFAVDGVLEINQTCAVSTGCFSGDTAGFPVTINGSAGRSYRLTSDLTMPDENTDGIKIDTDRISIDLNDFEIAGPATCSGVPLVCTRPGGGFGVTRATEMNRGISVKNGRITGMGNTGILLEEQSNVTNVQVRWNRNSGINVGGGSIVSGNTAYQNAREGIIASTSTGPGSGSIISGNTAYQNGRHGFSVNTGATVTGNAAHSNGGDGIGAGNGSTITGNTAHSNGSRGIIATDGSTISGNTAHSNGGRGIYAAKGSTVSGNTAYNNGGDGIYAGAGASVRLNTVRENGHGSEGGYGLNLVDNNNYFPDATYRENTSTRNTTGAVNGGINLGDNYCEGTGITSPTCP